MYFGVNSILQKFCLCKKNDKYEVWSQKLRLLRGFFLEPGSTWDSVCVWETILTVRQTIDIHCVLSTRGHFCYTLVTITCGIVCENVELNFHSVFLCLLKLKCAFFHLRPQYVLIYMYSMYSSYSDVYSPVSLSHMIELHAPRTWEFDFKPALSKSVHQYNDNVTCLLLARRKVTMMKQMICFEEFVFVCIFLNCIGLDKVVTGCAAATLYPKFLFTISYLIFLKFEIRSQIKLLPARNCFSTLWHIQKRN